MEAHSSESHSSGGCCSIEGSDIILSDVHLAGMGGGGKGSVGRYIKELVTLQGSLSSEIIANDAKLMDNQHL